MIDVNCSLQETKAIVTHLYGNLHASKIIFKNVEKNLILEIDFFGEIDCLVLFSNVVKIPGLLKQRHLHFKANWDKAGILTKQDFFSRVRYRIVITNQGLTQAQSVFWKAIKVKKTCWFFFMDRKFLGSSWHKRSGRGRKSVIFWRYVKNSYKTVLYGRSVQ